MNQEDFLYYLEAALKNLDATKALRFNIEGEVIRLMKICSPEEIKKKAGGLSYDIPQKGLSDEQNQ